MIPRDVIEDVVEEWADDIQKEKVIHRDLTEEIEDSLRMEEVTVVKGVRRSGKTFILYELFKKHGGVYLNFEDERFYDFTIEDLERIVDIAKDRSVKILYPVLSNRKIEGG